MLGTRVSKQVQREIEMVHLKSSNVTTLGPQTGAAELNEYLKRKNKVQMELLEIAIKGNKVRS